MSQERPPRPAATVVPIRDGHQGIEVLLLQRTSKGAFGGMWVFPGGQVDAGDLAGAVAEAGTAPVEDRGARGLALELAAARRAAVREAKEEAGLVLEEGQLVALSHWVPPAEAPRRFATWFFLARAPERGSVAVDGGEIESYLWTTPGGALEARESGRIHVVAPTYMTLWWLGHFSSAAEALSAASSRPPERFRTKLAADGLGGVRASVWEGDAAYADGNLARQGPRRRLVMEGDRWSVDFSSHWLPAR